MRKQSTRLIRIRYSITVATVVTVMLVFLASCSKGKDKLEEVELNLQELPSMSTLDVVTLVSDSGVTRYRIDTKEWLMFETVEEPYWYFPQGIYLEKFDSLFQTDAFVKGDTAIYKKNDQLWEIRGNVLMENLNHETFATEQIFWDQKKQKIYSDKFIHIEKEDRIIEGYGFESNEPMTKYVIHRTQGIFPIEMKNDTTTTPSDTLAQQEAEKARTQQR